MSRFSLFSHGNPAAWDLCYIFSQAVYMFPLLCPSLSLVEEQALNLAQVQEGFAPATHPFSQCCQGFWTEISVQLVWDNYLSEPKGWLCNMNEVLLCEDAGFTSKHAGALQRWEEQQHLQALHRPGVPWWKCWKLPGITQSSIGNINKSDVGCLQPFWLLLLQLLVTDVSDGGPQSRVPSS